MSSTDPSIDCDCRRKSVRNVRIVAIAVFISGLVVRGAAFAPASVPKAVCDTVLGLALVTYGIATMLDETATFPRWLYALFALVGALVTALASSSLL